MLLMPRRGTGGDGPPWESGPGVDIMFRSPDVGVTNRVDESSVVEANHTTI